MDESVNRQWLLVRRPVGTPKISDFEYREVDVPEPGSGEILLHIVYALVDPAQRGWMDAGGNYWDPLPLGQPVRSGILAKVVASNSAQHPVGTICYGCCGMARLCRGARGKCGPSALRRKPGSARLFPRVG